MNFIGGILSGIITDSSKRSMQKSVSCSTCLNKHPSAMTQIIIFSADHGEACGSHQMFQKFTLYEESIRVPFIVACLGDGVPVQKNRFDREHFISGVDVVPTVYDYAGIEAPEAVEGRAKRCPKARRGERAPAR